MPKVSVLMPVYNAQQYLAQAIESILEQSFTDFELVIVNDGSTDSSENIILSYSDVRIKYLLNSENKGLIYTRNRMIEISSGEYIAFLDSDDVSMPERLEQQVCFLDANANYGLCGTWGEMIDENGNVIKKINMPTEHDAIKCSLLFINTFMQSSIMIRKQILINHPYNKDYPLAEDYELWCRLVKQYRLKNLPICLTKYRWHETNISKFKKDHLDSLVRNIYCRELKTIGLNASDTELSLHSAIRDKNILPVSSKYFYKELRIWMRKVTKAAIKSHNYNKNTLLAVIVFRWIFVCKERKAYSKLLLPPVLLNFKAILILMKLLRDRI